MGEVINILGINISTLSKQNVLKKIEHFLNDGRQRQIVTPNPEFILNAREDEEFFYILNNADLAIPDGIGLKFAGWAMGKNLHRIAGADLIYDICGLAEKEEKSIFLLGGVGDTALFASQKLQSLYPNLKIVGAEEGLRADEWDMRHGKWIKGQDKNNKLIEKINEKNPDIIFVAFGGKTKQEKWIYHALAPSPSPNQEREAEKKLNSVKIAIGIGGTFNYISGKVKRAPKFLKLLGLEWLWRLFKQPWRWKRIYRAVIVFPWEFLKWRFVLPFLYRPNVACILYKKENNKLKILLVQRSDQENHWQLPQGGTDGDSLENAGRKELSEELGTDKFKIIACFKNLYKYKFDEELRRYNLIVKNIVGYKGQKQSLCVAEFLGRDKDVKINFWDHNNWKWGDTKNLINEVHPVRKEAAEIFLEKFNEVVKKN